MPARAQGFGEIAGGQDRVAKVSLRGCVRLAIPDRGARPMKKRMLRSVRTTGDGTEQDARLRRARTHPA